jgi:hypothetical protein
MPANEAWFADRLRDLERQIAELRAARTLANATVDGNGLTSANFDGTLNPPTAGTKGWGLSGTTGDAVFNNLTLRGELIGNEALTNPVSVTIGNGFTAGLTIGIAASILHTETLSIPEGFSQALVFCSISVGATSPSGGGNLFIHPNINGADGDEIAQAAGGSAFATSAASSMARVITGQTGGSLTVSAVARASSAGWTGGDGHVSAFAVFLR